MKHFSLAILLLASCAVGAPPTQEEAAKRIIDAVAAGNDSYNKLQELCDDVGHRLSGSKGLENAVAWGVARLKADGQENVRAEKLMVPKWVRGRESLVMLEPREHAISMLGLGGSVGTEGITAEVVVVRSKKELDALATAEGKIVLFNAPMAAYDPVKGAGYGEAVQYRSSGAVWAAEKGAVAALVRSVTAHSLRTPHTGAMRYADGKKKIPAASVSVEDAELMARLCARGKKVVVKLMMEAHDDGMVESANVVGELVGREKPEEIVIVSGHLDSWDVGQGAQDDGGGCVCAMEVLNVLRKLGLRPRRTIRVVLWTNEENGMLGVKTYLKDHAAELANHIAAIESDIGVFNPVQFGVDINDADRLKLAGEQLARIVKPLALKSKTGSSSSDVGNFKVHGVPALGLDVEGSRYFDYHHTPADTVDNVNPKELSNCVAAMAVVAYSIAEMKERFGGEPAK